MSDISYSQAPDFGLMRQQASSAYQTALAQLQARRRELLDQSGFHYSLDPNGNLQMGTLDPTKQFGAMQLMLSQQGQELQDNAQQQAQRGLGQYGMSRQKDSLLRFMHAQQQMQQATGLQGSLSDIGLQQQGAQTDLNNQLAGVASQEGQYNAQQAQYQAQVNAQQQAAQQAQQAQQMFTQQLLAALQGGGGY